MLRSFSIKGTSDAIRLLQCMPNERERAFGGKKGNAVNLNLFVIVSFIEICPCLIECGDCSVHLKVRFDKHNLTSSM